MIDSVINDIEVCNTIHEEKFERRKKDKKMCISISMSVFYCEICAFDYIISLYVTHYTHISRGLALFTINIILLLLITIQLNLHKVKLQIIRHKKIPKASNVAGNIILML